MFTLLQAAQNVAAEAAQAATEAVQNVAAEATQAATETAQVVTEVVTDTQAPAEGFSGWSTWIMIGAMILIMYFFMWRPESKRRKEMQKFREGLKAGDKVITAGGIYAVIKEVKETSLLIEVDSNVTLRIDKNMVVAAPESK